MSELHWREGDFWDATPHALYAAIKLRDGGFEREAFEAFRKQVER